MHELDLRLFGNFLAIVDGVEADDRRWSRKKAKTLVKLLALAPGRQMHREQVAAILWPEMDGEQSLNNLHKVMHAARRALEPDLEAGGASRFLLTQDQQISLRNDPAVFVDVTEFERLSFQGLKNSSMPDLEAAAALATGDLLEEDRYEDWAVVRREQLRVLLGRVLDRLATLHEQAGETDRAVELLDRLVKQNPSDEEAHRGLMRIYARTGRRHLALEQYQVCSEALRTTVEAEPEPATQELHQQIIAGRICSEPAGSAPIISSGRAGRKWIFAGSLGVILLAAGSWGLWHGALRPQQVDSLAVLPLESGGELGDVGDVGDGITESIINGISQLPNLKVMARSTVFRYRGQIVDPRWVGRQLGVGAVLTGGVSQRGDVLTIRAELVQVRDGAQLWGQRYTLPAKDLTLVQQRLSAEIVAAIRMKLTPDQQLLLAGRNTTNAEAYRLYLRGRFFLNKRNQEGYRVAIDQFQQAIDRDPSFAAAYAGMADSYGLLGWQNGSAQDFLPKAQAAAARALQLDERLAEAHTSLAMVHALYSRDWAAAENEFRRALALNPGYATAHHWYGVHLGAMGRFAESAVELQKAQELDPLSPIILVNRGYPAYYERRYPEAIAQFRRALELDPAFQPAHGDLMNAYELLGQPEKAAEEASLLLRTRESAELADRFVATYRKSGYPEAIHVWLADTEARAVREYVSPMDIAQLHLSAGDRDQALGWLEKAFDQRCAPLSYLAVDPRYDRLRAEPRFQALLHKLNLPAAGK